MTAPNPTPGGGAKLLRELLAKATPGPWQCDDDALYIFGPEFRMVADNHDGLVARMRGFGGGEPQAANMHLIVAAVNALPALLEAWEERARVEDENKRLRELFEHVAQHRILSVKRMKAMRTFLATGGTDER